MLENYDFDYNVPYENDQLGKADCMIPVRATLIPLCSGLGPVVAISFREVFACQIQRVINLTAAIRDMESIAIAHFIETLNQPFTTIRIAS